MDEQVFPLPATTKEERWALLLQLQPIIDNADAFVETYEGFTNEELRPYGIYPVLVAIYSIIYPDLEELALRPLKETEIDIRVVKLYPLWFKWNIARLDCPPARKERMKAAGLLQEWQYVLKALRSSQTTFRKAWKEAYFVPKKKTGNVGDASDCEETVEQPVLAGDGSEDACAVGSE